MNLAALISLINKYLIEKIASHRNFCSCGSMIVIKFAAWLAKSCILAPALPDWNNWQNLAIFAPETFKKTL